MKYDEFGELLLSRYKSCSDRDGSQAFDSILSIHQYYRLYELLEKYGAPDDTVLDWGCGSGHFSLFLASQRFKTHGFGFSPPGLISNEIESGAVSFKLGDATEPTKLPYDDATFDLVVSVGVLEHVREYGGDEGGSLSEIRRILKPGGHFICVHFPNRWSWIEALSQALGRWHHRYRYERKEILSLFGSAQFALLECARYGIFPRNIFGKILPQRLRGSQGVAKVFDFLDAVFSIPFRPICQNWLVVAKNKS